MVTPQTTQDTRQDTLRVINSIRRTMTIMARQVRDTPNLTNAADVARMAHLPALSADLVKLQLWANMLDYTQHDYSDGDDQNI